MEARVHRRVWTGVVAGSSLLCVAVLLAYAVLSDGYPVRKVDLNDSGIWVTSNATGTFGRFNKSASYLDAVFNPPGGSQASYDLDILQDQGSVIARDLGGGQVFPVDVATGQVLKDAGADVSPNAVVQMEAGTIAVLDPVKGLIWAVRYDPGSQVTALSAIRSAGDPLAKTDAPAKGADGAVRFSALAVGTDGSVHVVSRSGKLVTVPVLSGQFGKPVTSSVADQLGVVGISAIGANPVVLDESSGAILLGRKRSQLPDSEGTVRLQAPVVSGPIAVATTRALYSVAPDGSLADRPLAEISAGGAPAAPVQARGCVFAAWAGSPGNVVRTCNGTASPIPLDGTKTLTTPVFRVNRNVALLNDTTDGRVFDLDLQQSFDQWKEVRPPDQNAKDKPPQAQNVEDKKNKPEAHDDELGARPGRTTVLHVLDNDTDPSGKILSIARVTDPGNPNAQVSISPDGQTIMYRLAEGSGESDFEYDLSNGINTARGSVHVIPSVLPDNKLPKLFAPPKGDLVVANGGTTTIPITDGWRDWDGDPITIVDSTPASGSTISTPDGRIEFTAAAEPAGGNVTVKYRVSDGVGKPVEGSVKVKVLARDATSAVAATTAPDVARGEVGKPIVITPLSNDVQGADPLNPRATMALASAVAAKGGVQVATDLDTGEIVATPEKKGTYFLSYSVGFGSAANSSGKIRVDALEPKDQEKPVPVAMPDHAAVHGQAPVVVDVLANDIDPAGGMLTVTAAAAEDPNQARVAVLKGRWLRIMPSSAELDPNPALIHYTVTNGTAQANGDVLVTQLAALTNDPPVTRPDYGSVRDGDAVLIPVLDNDATLGGRPLSLASDVPGQEVAGRLVVTNPAAKNETAGDLGAAYVSGNQVRYLAPATVTEPMQLQIEYVAQNDLSQTGRGTVYVTVNPQPHDGYENRSPQAKPLNARAVAGQTLTIDVDPYGNDPDGDSTSVVGIASAPSLGLGRVMGTSPNGITYQAYPGSVGLDSFSYTISDRYGKQATSLVRVAVIPPALPQPPVSVPDSVTAAPGTTVTVVPLANDFYAATDPVRLVPLDQTNDPLPPGVKFDPASNTLRIPTPAASDRPTVVHYKVSGVGGVSPPADIVVSGQSDVRLPPRAFDVIGKADGLGQHASADVLASAYDPDGDSRKLVVSVLGNSGAIVSAGEISAPLIATSQAIPFEVKDETGATSVALFYVPPAGGVGPYLKPGALIKVGQGQTLDLDLSAYVADGEGKPVMFTRTNRMWPSPAPLVTAEISGKNTFTVTGSKDRFGPAALVVEVTNGATLDDPKGTTGIVSIPIQVGPETPVLNCPEDELVVVAGGNALPVDPTSLCSVWTATPQVAQDLRYKVQWTKPLDHVSIAGSDEHAFALQPGGEATPGAQGAVTVKAVGTQAVPGTLNVKVVAAGKPMLSPINLPEMSQGDSREIDLNQYVTSPLKDKQITVVSIAKTSGAAATQSADGSRVTITPGEDSHGPMVFKVVISDVANKARTDRQVSGTISFDVFGKPDTPRGPQPGSTTLSHTAELSWAAPAANGAPIQKYTVKWAGGQKTCPTTPCTITGLDNGQTYSFQVSATNKAGESAFSKASSGYVPDEAPKAVPNFQQAGVDDHSVTLRWNPAPVDGTDVSDYVIAVNGQQYSAGRALTKTITGLDNGPKYTFTIVAKNNYGPGPAATTDGYAAGDPILTGPVSFGPVALADEDSTAVEVRWPPADPNGPSTPTYTVTRDDGKSVCAGAEAANCTDTGVRYGTTYTYRVVARTTFLGTTRSSQTQSASITPVGKPGGWQPISATATGSNNQIRLTYSVPPSRGATSSVAVLVNNGVNTSFSAPAAGTGSQTRTISVPGNGVDYSIQMRVCNEDNRCSTSNTVTANAYGPIPTPTVSLSKDAGTTFQVHVTANGNGRQISVHVWTDTGRSWDFSTSGSRSWDSGQYGVNYSQGDRAHVTISDTAGRSVPGQVNSNSQTADPPPAPKIYVSHDSAGLAYIRLQDFRPNSQVYCWVDGSGGWVNWDVTWTVNGSGDHAATSRGNQGNLHDPDHLMGDGEYTQGDLCRQL